MQTACKNVGLDLGTDMYLAINCAAHELMDYVSYFSVSVFLGFKINIALVNIIYYYVANSPMSS